QTPLFPGNYQERMKKDFNCPLKITYTTKSHVGTSVSEYAQQAVEKIVKWLDKNGHIVEEKDHDIDGIRLMKDYYFMNSGEVSMVMQQLERTMGRTITREDVEIETYLLHVAGQSVSAAE